jgi:hypothetical protein
MGYFAFGLRRQLHKLVVLVGALLAMTLSTETAHAQAGDGPRAWHPAPINLNILSLVGIYSNGNNAFESGAGARHAAGLALQSPVGMALYNRIYRFPTGQMANFGFGLSYGSVQGELRPFNLKTNRIGFGDAFIVNTIGLIGMPALTAQEFATFTPSFTMSLLTMATLPTGTYNKNNVLNIGSNRWTGRIGVPMSYFFDYGPGRTTSLDLLPSVTFYTRDDAKATTQKPYFRLEAHLTRDITPTIWVSIDSIYSFGGETSVAGVSQNDRKASLSLGGSLGVKLTPTTSMLFSAGTAVYHNKAEFDGYLARAILSHVF